MDLIEIKKAMRQQQFSPFHKWGNCFEIVALALFELLKVSHSKQ
jgi:hypothetical protein